MPKKSSGKGKKQFKAKPKVSAPAKSMRKP